MGKKIKEKKEIIEKIDNEFKIKQKLPKEEKEKINKRLFRNVLVAIGFVLYFYFINLGAINIKPDVFLTDLKVFSITLVAVAIIIFEVSYKKEDGKLCIYGIETLIISFCSLLSIYFFSLFKDVFNLIIANISLLIAVYYIAKCIIIRKKMKKQYYQSLSDINDIIKKESKRGDIEKND